MVKVFTLSRRNAERKRMDGEASFYQSLCHNYQAKLKTKAQNLSESSWIQSKALLFNKQSPGLSYTPVLLCIKEADSPSIIKNPRSKKRKIDRKHVKTYKPENQQEISLSDLLKHDKKKILLAGAAGSGKTVVVHQMLKLWAETKDKDINYMFYFDMRETPHDVMIMSLEDLLFSVFSEPDEGRDEVLQDIQTNSDRVVIIFDGLTDLPSSSVVGELIYKNLLPQSKIIITCRPEVESSDLLSDWDPLRVEVKGFSEHGIREYLSKNLSEEHMNNVFSNIKVFSLCHTPVYALMVVAFFSFEGSEHLPQPCTLTEIYLNILHFCIQRSSNTTYERDAIASLAEAAFLATQSQTQILTSVTCEDSCVHSSFLKTFEVQVTRGVWKTSTAFKHSTLQEFFAALWLLMNPERIRGFIQQWTTDRLTHVKHLILFMCGLLNEQNTDVLESLIPAKQLSDLKEVLITFTEFHQQDRHTDDLLFLCQCLYESQSPDICLFLLDKLDYCLDVRGGTLSPQDCFALSYVISQCKEKKIQLNFSDVTVSEEGSVLQLESLGNVQRCYSLLQLWTISLINELEMNYVCLLGLDGNRLHLPVRGDRRLFEQAGKLTQKSTEKIKVCLHWDNSDPVCPYLSEFLLKCSQYIHSLSFRKTHRPGSFQEQKPSCEILESEEKQLLLDLCLEVFHKGEEFPRMVDTLLALFSAYSEKHDILLTFYQCITAQGILSDFPMLRPLFQSAPAVWSINLSEGKSSILLEVLKLQPEKKEVKLTVCSHEENEVRSFLQCLPYISQLSLNHQRAGLWNHTRFLVNLFCAAAERQQQTGEKILELLSSVCSYETFPVKDHYNMNFYDNDMKYQSDFLLDLYSHLKDCETKTGLSVLPSLQSVFQSAPAVWSINLSERKTSILLEVLKLQPEKKQVELTDCSHEESEVRSFLQCLPYISQLRFCHQASKPSEQTQFFGILFCAAAQREQYTEENILELLSLHSHQKIAMKVNWVDFLLDLYSYVKDYETKTGLSVLPSLQSVFQSAPAVWSINLSERKTSILLEVLKLQPEKKQVELTGCSHEESEVRSFLQFLPYISQLSLMPELLEPLEETKFFRNLFCAAAEREQQTGEKILELLSSVCRYKNSPLKEKWCDFLMDLYSYETKSGLSVLPSLQSVFQSAPAVWSINLSERKTSILLEVLKLQPEKKQVKLTGCSHEESEVRSFLQCLPYISQLSCCKSSETLSNQTRLFVNLFCAAAEREQQTGEKILELLSSVCTYQTFPVNVRDMDFKEKKSQCDFLLDLCSHIKDYETKTGLSILPSLQSVFQSAPAVWSINLSERKTSILLEVLKLQPEKKQVKLTGCSHEESEVTSFLQCLPYISQLR
ncbi:unnamed protein product [Oreochromis niloticus]|nr:unnamed protein product [Mustela putorius furo]